MKFSQVARWWTTLLALAIWFGPAHRLSAATVVTGNVTPALPWTSSTSPRVGNTGNGTLVVDGGSKLSSGGTSVGRSASAAGDVLITGPATTWNNGASLYVGYEGAGNLRIESGAHVTSNFAGLGVFTGSVGTATVYGTDSVWSDTGRISVGGGVISSTRDGGNGSLQIVAGGRVDSLYASVGATDASTGEVTITGIGSQWNSTSDLIVGNRGNGALWVQDGGALRSGSGRIGDQAGTTGELTVEGGGSQWINSGDLRIGQSGHGTLRVESGGYTSSRNSYVGGSTDGTGLVTVAGQGSQWVNSGIVHVGQLGTASLTVADGGHVTAATLFASLSDLYGNGTIAATQGAVLDADLVFDAEHGLHQKFAFGTGGVLSITAQDGGLGVGYKATGNLRIADGAKLNSSAGYLAYNLHSTGTATVIGQGTEWNMASIAYVGLSGDGSLLVDQGGFVSSARGDVGSRKDARGTVQINGAGSIWNSGARTYVGGEGVGIVSVTDHGQLTTGTLYASLVDCFGDGSITATQGVVLDVDLVFDAVHGTTQIIPFGSGGQLTFTMAQGVLGAGYKGAGTVRIAEGLVITSVEGNLGYHSGATGRATVSGAGSKWLVSGAMQVGGGGDLYGFHQGGNGHLQIEQGGEVACSDGYVGFATDSVGSAIVTGTGSQWQCETDLYIGGFGLFHGGQRGWLHIENGGRVSNTDGYMGYRGAASEVVVAGLQSVWENRGRLFVGFNSGNNQLRIENGGRVTAADAVIGKWGSLTAETIVSGDGADLTIENLLVIASGASIPGELTTATLKIEAGGRVSNTHAYVGSGRWSLGIAISDGPGSVWSTSEDLVVGNFGTGSVTIVNGGLISVGRSLSIDLNGASPSSSISLATGGMLALSGDADDSLSQFLGLIQGTDAIRYWSDTLSAWAPLTSATLGVDYTLEYLTTGDLAGYTLLTVGTLPVLAGDFNVDGVVDAADYTVWRDGLDTIYTQADFDLWKANFGNTYPEFPAAALAPNSVPEPSTVWLAAFCVAVATCGITARTEIQKTLVCRL